MRRVAPLIRASSDAGSLFMAGSDFIDTLSSAYLAASQGLRQILVVVAYLSLISLTKGEKANPSMLFDHLYSLKSQSSKAGTGSTLLADVVTNTPLISKLSTSVVGKHAERAHTLAAALAPLKSNALARPRPVSRRKPTKGKAIVSKSSGHEAVSHEQHMHRISSITQVQDLFPDLGSGFVSRLLDEYDENVEQVTAHLLDDSLPPHPVSYTHLTLPTKRIV